MRDNKDKRLEKKQLLAIREKVASFLLVDVELIFFLDFLIRVIIVQFVVERYNIYSLSCTIGGCF